MKFKTILPLLAFCLCANGTVLRAQDADGSHRDAQLQTSLLQFPLLMPVTNSNGQPDFQTLALENPVLIDGKKYYGFRFKVPPRKSTMKILSGRLCSPETPGFRWLVYLASNGNHGGPYPNRGSGQGFTNYFYSPKKHLSACGRFAAVEWTEG